MDPAALLAEIESGPLAAELAPLVAARDFNGVAAALNRPTQPGHVPRRHLVVTLARHPQVDGLVKWVIQFGTLPAPLGGGPADFGLYCLFQSVSRIAANDVGVLLMVDDVAAFRPQLAGLEAGGVIPPGFFPDLLAGEVRLGRAEKLWGAPVTGSDCLEACGGD